MADMWNVVYVEGGYRLVDVVWASVCEVRVTDPTVTNCEHDGSIVHHVNDFYFLTDPDMMITTHLPYDDKWQLLPKPITKTQFLNTVYIRERYYELSLYPTEDTQTLCLLRPKDGHVLLDFGFDDNKNMELKCHVRQLYPDPTYDNSALTLADYLMYVRCDNHAGYRWRHPHSGLFEMNIYGRDKQQHYKTYELVCQYTIRCDKAQKDCQKLPAFPDIGWGPGPSLQGIKIYPYTHTKAIIPTDTGSVNMVFINSKKKKVKLELEHNTLSGSMLKTSLLYWTDKQSRKLNVQLRLPKMGEYRLAMYKKPSLFGFKDRNVCNYLINVQSVDDIETFPLLRGPLGPSALCEELGVEPVSHVNNFIKATAKECNIVLTHLPEYRMVCELTSNHYDREFVAQHAIGKCLEDGKSQSQLNFIDQGQYGVNLFVVKQGDSRLFHVYTYIAEHGEMKQLERKQMNRIFPPPTPATLITCSSNITTTVIIRNTDRKLMAELTVTDMNVQENEAGSINIGGKSGTRKAIIEVCDMIHLATYQLSIFEEVTKGSIRCLAVYKIIRQEEAEEVSLHCKA